jgi:hypothetical protein
MRMLRPSARRVICRTGRGSFSIVTVNVHESTLPQTSRASQVTVVVPTGKKLPDGLEQVTVRFVVQSSVAETV